MLLDTLGGSLLRNLLTEKFTITAGKSTIRTHEGTTRAGQDL